MAGAVGVAAARATGRRVSLTGTVRVGPTEVIRVAAPVRTRDAKSARVLCTTSTPICGHSCTTRPPACTIAVRTMCIRPAAIGPPVPTLTTKEVARAPATPEEAAAGCVDCSPVRPAGEATEASAAAAAAPAVCANVIRAAPAVCKGANASPSPRPRVSMRRAGEAFTAT